MKKISVLFTAILLLLVVNSASAQEKFNTKKMSFGAGIYGGVGMISDSPYSNNRACFGLDVKAEYRLMTQLGINVNTGLMLFGDSKNFDDNFSMVPITVGANWYFGKVFYVGAKSGLAIYTKGHADPVFTFVPLAGVRLLDFLDISAQFQFYANNPDHLQHSPQFIGIRVGVNF